MKRAVLVLALFAPSVAAAQSPPPCAAATARPLALDAETSLEGRVRYAVTGTHFAVCVEQAALPYSAQRGHQPMIVLRVYDGAAESRFVIGPGQYVKWHGYRVEAHIDRPSFTATCGVALAVRRAT